MNSTYKKIIITKKGGIENLKLISEKKEDLYKSLSKNFALVKVLTAGLAFADIMMREGTYPNHPPYPFTPGYDIVGRIEEIYENPYNLKKGDYIASLTVHGGYSEYLLVPIENLIPISILNTEKEISITTLAEINALILNYITAYQMLFRITSLNKDDYILIHGGGGGVGTALIQLTDHYKFHNTYTTISRRKYEIIKKYKIKPIFYQEESFKEFCKKNQLSFQLILDPIGGKHIFDSYEVLNKHGSLILYGTYNFLKEGISSMLYIPLLYLKNFINFNNKKVKFYLIGQKQFGGYDSIKTDFNTLLELYKNHNINPIIDTIYEFNEDNVKLAHKRLQEGNVKGKIIFSMI